MFISGVASTMFGSLVGLGGGLIFVPVLLFLSNYYDVFSCVNPQSVVAFYLLLMFFTGFFSRLTYLKGKWVNVKCGFIFLIVSISGALTCVWLDKYFHTVTFELYFGILVIILSILFIIKDKVQNITLAGNRKQKKYYVHRTIFLYNKEITYSYSLILGIMIAFIVGML